MFSSNWKLTIIMLCFKLQKIHITIISLDMTCIWYLKSSIIIDPMKYDKPSPTTTTIKRKSTQITLALYLIVLTFDHLKGKSKPVLASSSILFITSIYIYSPIESNEYLDWIFFWNNFYYQFACFDRTPRLPTSVV